MIENMLLNAVVQNRDFGALVRHGLNGAKYFPDLNDAYQFIQKHMKEFGEMPSCESVSKACDGFERVEVFESIDTLCLKLNERNLKLEEKELLTELATKFGELDGYDVLEKLKAKVDKWYDKSMARGHKGVNWSQNGQERLEEYNARKNKEFSKKIPCFLPELGEAIGEFERGDYVTIQAFTNKGKTWLGLLEALVANNSGFRVVIESAEMNKTANSFRLDTINAGFNNRGLWTGQLNSRAEEAYTEYTQKFNKSNGRSDLIIKTAEDWSNGLTLEQIEHDIQQTKCDLIVVDQFSLIKFKSSKREDKEECSRNLKQLAAKHGVVLILLYQANGDYEKSNNKGTGEDGIRELKVPTLEHYSSTIAVIQDSDFVIGFDSVVWKDPETGRSRGKALCGVTKSRSSGLGTEVEMEWLPNDGLIRARMATDIF